MKVIKGVTNTTYANRLANADLLLRLIARCHNLLTPYTLYIMLQQN